MSGGEIILSNFESMRKRAGLTQQESARKLGVSQGAVSQWENGNIKPRAAILIKLAELYDCTIDDLLAGTSRELTVPKLS